MSDSLDAYLVLSGILFAIGSFGFLARRNAISMLMSIELMLNAVNLSIIAFGAFVPELGAQATIIALMVMAVAAGEATVQLGLSPAGNRQGAEEGAQWGDGSLDVLRARGISLGTGLSGDSCQERGGKDGNGGEGGEKHFRLFRPLRPSAFQRERVGIEPTGDT